MAGNNKPFVVYVSVRFIVLTLIGSAFVAFNVGKLARRHILKSYGLNHTTIAAATGDVGVLPEGEEEPQQQQEQDGLPHPLVPKKKQVPHTIYTSKTFDTGRSTSDTLLARQHESEASWVVLDDREDGEEEEEEEMEESEHEPSGQHLLIDIEHVDGVFLNSKERLAQAMVDLVDSSGLTMLSYHCHGLEPMGVSCAGVLLESHVSFHTWPVPGVITLDLFTCGPMSLVPLVPMIKDLFSIPKPLSAPTYQEPHMLWSFKRRGFRKSEDGSFDPGTSDVYNFLLGVMEYEEKKRIASVQTDFQTVEIYDIIHPRFNSVEDYKQSLSGDGSYKALHPEFYQPDRIVYLDGVMQSRRMGDAGYHEALVHPAMFTVDDPAMVVIIGGGEGATLREVLKHKTVEKVVMVEIDEKMVDASKEYLPEWSDCSDLIGSTPSCFDDPRVTVIYADAVQWFIDHYGKDTKYEDWKYPEVDVIIMDALDPGDNAFFSDLLYNNVPFTEALFNSLDETGVFISQTGSADDMLSADQTMTRFGDIVKFKNNLERVGFEVIQDYEAPHGGFMGVWSFFIAMNHYDLRHRWFSNEAQIKYQIGRRMLPTKSGEPSLRYFDGATMQEYHFPSKPDAVVFCRTHPTKFGCGHHGEVAFDKDVRDIPASAFEVKESSIENAGRGLFATVDIPKGSYINVGEGVRDLYIDQHAYEVIYNWLEGKDGIGEKWKFFDPFLYGYGFANNFFGEDRSVDTGIFKFMNHGCNGSWNVGLESEVTEQTADENDWSSEKNWKFEYEVHNPLRDRMARVLTHINDIARRDIKAGEEMLDNFLSYPSTEKMWKRAVRDLRGQCTEARMGSISDYEKKEE